MLVSELKKVAYDPARFIDIENVDEAVNIILCPTEGLTAQQRWSDEAPVLMGIIEKYIKPESMVLDYGCGIGRLAKPLIEKHRCKVVGVDISPNMRALAASLVDSPMFCALDPQMFDSIPFRDHFDAAISVWALQHCLDLQQAITRIYDTMKTGGRLVLVNNVTRCLPVENGEWADDGVNINATLIEWGFHRLDGGQLDASIAPGWMQQGTFWAAYEKR